MALNFQRLESEVAEMGSVVDGVVKLLETVAEDIRNNAGNQAKLEELATQLDTKATALATAAAANTPAEGGTVDPNAPQPTDPNAPQPTARRR